MHILYLNNKYDDCAGRGVSGGAAFGPRPRSLKGRKNKKKKERKGKEKERKKEGKKEKDK